MTADSSLVLSALRVSADGSERQGAGLIGAQVSTREYNFFRSLGGTV